MHCITCVVCFARKALKTLCFCTPLPESYLVFIFKISWFKTKHSFFIYPDRRCHTDEVHQETKAKQGHSNNKLGFTGHLAIWKSNSWGIMYCWAVSKSDQWKIYTCDRFEQKQACGCILTTPPHVTPLLPGSTFIDGFSSTIHQKIADFNTYPLRYQFWKSVNNCGAGTQWRNVWWIRQDASTCLFLLEAVTYTDWLN